MLMEMCMRLAGWIARAVLMPVMFIMRVRVRVCHWLMEMLMLVLFREVQPNTNGHEGFRPKAM